MTRTLHLLELMGRPEIELDENITIKAKWRVFVAIATVTLVVFGTLVSGVWWWRGWTAHVDSELSSIKTLITQSAASDGKQGGQIDDLSRRLLIIETVGSPRVQNIEKALSEVERQIESMKARSQQNGAGK